MALAQVDWSAIDRQTTRSASQARSSEPPSTHRPAPFPYDPTELILDRHIPPGSTHHHYEMSSDDDTPLRRIAPDPLSTSSDDDDDEPLLHLTNKQATRPPEPRSIFRSLARSPLPGLQLDDNLIGTDLDRYTTDSSNLIVDGRIPRADSMGNQAKAMRVTKAPLLATATTTTTTAESPVRRSPGRIRSFEPTKGTTILASQSDEEELDPVGVLDPVGAPPSPPPPAPQATPRAPPTRPAEPN